MHQKTFLIYSPLRDKSELDSKFFDVALKGLLAVQIDVDNMKSSRNELRQEQ